VANVSIGKPWPSGLFAKLRLEIIVLLCGGACLPQTIVDIGWSAVIEGQNVVQGRRDLQRADRRMFATISRSVNGQIGASVPIFANGRWCGLPEAESGRYSFLC
jgi:hypothetical protein